MACHAAGVLGSAIGPLAFAWAYDGKGQYDWIMMACVRMWHTLNSRPSSRQLCVRCPVTMCSVSCPVTRLAAIRTPIQSLLACAFMSVCVRRCLVFESNCVALCIQLRGADTRRRGGRCSCPSALSALRVCLPWRYLGSLLTKENRAAASSTHESCRRQPIDPID